MTTPNTVSTPATTPNHELQVTPLCRPHKRQIPLKPRHLLDLYEGTKMRDFRTSHLPWNVGSCNVCCFPFTLTRDKNLECWFCMTTRPSHPRVKCRCSNYFSYQKGAWCLKCVTDIETVVFDHLYACNVSPGGFYSSQKKLSLTVDARDTECFVCGSVRCGGCMSQSEFSPVKLFESLYRCDRFIRTKLTTPQIHYKLTHPEQFYSYLFKTDRDNDFCLMAISDIAVGGKIFTVTPGSKAPVDLSQSLDLILPYSKLEYASPMPIQHCILYTQM